jgi:hypothetical protein
MEISNLHEALRQARPVTDEQAYCVIHLPASAITAAAGVAAQIGEPFLALVADHHEVTLVAHADAYQAIQRRLPDTKASLDWRLITFDAVLDQSLVGFLAAIAAALAEAGVSLFALSAYERDHILVKADQFDTAWAVLEKLAGQA